VEGGRQRQGSEEASVGSGHSEETVTSGLEEAGAGRGWWQRRTAVRGGRGV
jgi:hypothetical protein